MAYRFNNGAGGVTCDKCNILMDEQLSLDEYEKMWNEPGGDFCPNCKEKQKDRQKKDKRNGKAAIIG